MHPHPLGPTLETPRLVLRPPRAEDFEGWMELMGDEQATRFLGGVQSRSAAWRGFASITGAWVLNGFSMFTCLERSTGRFVGRLGPWRPEGWPGNEIGYGLVRAAWGKGYAVEGCSAAIDWALEHLGWTEFIHAIDPANAPSRALAARLGSQLLGPGRLPPPYENAPIELWGQTSAAWRARRAP